MTEKTVQTPSFPGTRVRINTHAAAAGLTVPEYLEKLVPPLPESVGRIPQEPVAAK